MDALFNTIMMAIVIAGGNVHNLPHDGHSEQAFVTFEFGVIPDSVCSLITRFIQQALTKLLVQHHLKMVSLLKFLNQKVIRAFNMALVFPLVPNYFANHIQRHHITDSFHCFWYSFQLWVFLGSYPLWHVIDSVFITNLPKEGIFNASIQGNQAASEGDTSIVCASEGDVSLGFKTDSSGVSNGANLHGFALQ